MATDEHLHNLAREIADKLPSPDKKQLRFNEIVDVAKSHYYGDVEAGVRELVWSCDRDDQLYVNKSPMWRSLRENYAWMAQ